MLGNPTARRPGTPGFSPTQDVEGVQHAGLSRGGGDSCLLPPSTFLLLSFFLSFSPAASLCGSFAYEGTMTITSPQRVLSPCLGQERWNAIRSCRCLCCPCCFLLFLLHRVCFLRPYSHHNISLPPERFVNCGKMLVARRVMHIVLAHHCNQRCAILCLIS